MTNIGIYHYLLLGAVIFLIGLFGVVISKELIRILLALEIMISGVCINFVSIGNLCDGLKFDGAIFTVFIAIISFIQTAIFVAIIINIFKHKKINDIEKLGELKG